MGVKVRIERFWAHRIKRGYGDMVSLRNHGYATETSNIAQPEVSTVVEMPVSSAVRILRRTSVDSNATGHTEVDNQLCCSVLVAL
jgi:hypothetical protein